MNRMIELAERVEKASGPDRELDWLIAEAVGEVPEHTVAENGTPYGWFRRPGEWSLWRTKESDPHAGVDLWQPKPRTASLDAAMSLVPEGWRVANMGETVIEGNDPWNVRLLEKRFDGRGKSAEGDAATPALALCAAALRSQSTIGEDK